MATKTMCIAFLHQQKDELSCFGLDIYCLLDNHLPIIQITVYLISLGMDGKPQAIPKVSNQEIVVESCNTVKFLWDRKKVFYIDQLIYDILQLVLVGIAEFCIDLIYENSDLSQAFLQDDFELGLDGKYQGFDSYFLLMLLLLVESSLFEEYSGKKNSIVASKVSYGKLIFVQLDKIITIYVGLVFINVWSPRLKNPLWGTFGNFPILAMSKKWL